MVCAEWECLCTAVVDVGNCQVYRNLQTKYHKTSQNITYCQPREARHPFLDEAFVHHVLQLPLWQVADLRREAGQGDKVLLRTMLRALGLPRYGVPVQETCAWTVCMQCCQCCQCCQCWRCNTATNTQGSRACQACNTVWHAVGHTVQPQGLWEQPCSQQPQCGLPAHPGCVR